MGWSGNDRSTGREAVGRGRFPGRCHGTGGVDGRRRPRGLGVDRQVRSCREQGPAGPEGPSSLCSRQVSKFPLLLSSSEFFTVRSLGTSPRDCTRRWRSLALWGCVRVHLLTRQSQPQWSRGVGEERAGSDSLPGIWSIPEACCLKGAAANKDSPSRRKTDTVFSLPPLSL